jgi:hypothetical protein
MSIQVTSLCGDWPSQKTRRKGTKKRGANSAPRFRPEIPTESPRLPAAPASAATITTITIPAATASASASAPSTSASASAASESATAAPASSAPAAFAWRASFIHDNIAAHEILTVESLDGALCFIVAIDLNESESPRLTRETVAHQGYDCSSNSGLSK